MYLVRCTLYIPGITSTVVQSFSPKKLCGSTGRHVVSKRFVVLKNRRGDFFSTKKGFVCTRSGDKETRDWLPTVLTNPRQIRYEDTPVPHRLPAMYAEGYYTGAYTRADLRIQLLCEWMKKTSTVRQGRCRIQTILQLCMHIHIIRTSGQLLLIFTVCCGVLYETCAR